MSGLDEAPAAAPDASAGRVQGQRWLWWVAAVAAVVLLVAVLLVLLWPATTWWVEHVDGVKLHGKGALTGADRQEALDKARGRITAVATGLLAAVAIYYTASNASSARQTARAAQESVQAALRAADHTDEAQRRTHELTERGQLTDRFTAAVAQLGDTNPAIQLGGVHALAGIADDAPRTFRQTCIDVLCAYLRLPYAPDPGPLPLDQHPGFPTDAERDAHDQQGIAYRGLREVRHTIIRLIGNHLRLPAEDPRSWQGHDFDFTDVVFDGGDLSGARFTGGTATFTNTTFTRDFSFRGAKFSGGHTSFERATFCGGQMDFRGAAFTGGLVDFGYATLTDGHINFGQAELSGGQIDFGRAELAGGLVNFADAELSGGVVDFGQAKLCGGLVNFAYATLSGGQVGFVNAKLTDGEINFGGTTFADGKVDFGLAWFSGTDVHFRHATFSGGHVSFATPMAWERPPTGILTDAEGRPPAGVSLPQPS